MEETKISLPTPNASFRKLGSTEVAQAHFPEGNICYLKGKPCVCDFPYPAIGSLLHFLL